MKRTRPGDGKLAIGYLRVSTEDQKLGPEAQRAAIAAWASREGVTVLAWHVDQGVSGGSEMDERAGLCAALGELRAVGAGLLLVAKRDRIARDVAVAATIDKAVEACGARVVAADGAGNGSSAADALLRTILDAAAQYERALIRQRTKAALDAKRAKGERTGTVRYGYRLAADGVRLEQEPSEQAILAEVHRLRAAGVTLRGIVAELARAGIASRAGRPFGLTQVADMAKAAA